MPPPVLTEEDHAFIREWRPHQTIPCLAKAIGTYHEIVDNFCRKHHLDGPYGRVSWLARDERPGRRGPRPPRRALEPAMPHEAAAFLRLWRPSQPLPDLARALELPEAKINRWCRRQKLYGPRRQKPAWHAEKLAQWELADLSDADRAFLLAERPHFYLADLADMVGVSEITVLRICREAQVWGPKWHAKRRQKR